MSSSVESIVIAGGELRDELVDDAAASRRPTCWIRSQIACAVVALELGR